MKTEFEFHAQRDVLTAASAQNPDRLKKLSDLRQSWRAAGHDQEKQQVACDELDAIAVEVKAEQDAAKPKPAAAAKTA